MYSKLSERMNKLIRGSMPYKCQIDLRHSVWVVQIVGREYSVLNTYYSPSSTHKGWRRRPTPKMWNYWQGERKANRTELSKDFQSFAFYDDGTIPTKNDMDYLRRLDSFGRWLSNNHFREDRDWHGQKWTYENAFGDDAQTI